MKEKHRGPGSRRVQLPEQDHYELAREAARRRLRECLDRWRLEWLGVRLTEGGHMELPCLCWTFGLEEGSLTPRLLPEGREPSIIWQILALHYLCASVSSPPARMLSLADFAEARLYAKPFEGRVLRRLDSMVGRDPDGFAAAAERCGGLRQADEPLRYRFRFFPRLDLEIVRHAGDDDFPAACNVLFPDNMLAIFSVEDGIVAAELLVSALKGKTPAD